MISVLFENDTLLKETSFGLDLLYQSELRLLKRKNKDLNLDVSFLKPDVLFVDLYNNSQGFIEKVKSIYSADKNIKIILLVDFVSEHIYWIAKKLKLSGILRKDVNTDEFIEKVLSTNTDSNYRCCKSHKSPIDIEQIIGVLSSTEITVFEFIGKGLTSYEISDSLGISKRTVDTHRTKILIKLNCKNSSKLIYIATVYNIFKLL